ncbi:hypothetical protein V502_06715 [Pseudogymnoascus sp. VKM F-4520 (FW-2644)]|nr:hypothetical protein V502_06715 [Pseudogymnoascus sp. VKM F-4520 (FW-2644)]
MADNQSTASSHTVPHSSLLNVHGPSPLPQLPHQTDPFTRHFRILQKRQRVRNHGSLQSPVSNPRAGQSAAAAQISWDQEQRQKSLFWYRARCKDFVRESFGAGAQGWDDGAGGEVGCDEMNYSFESGTPVLVFACTPPKANDQTPERSEPSTPRRTTLLPLPHLLRPPRLRLRRRRQILILPPLLIRPQHQPQNIQRIKQHQQKRSLILKLLPNPLRAIRAQEYIIPLRQVLARVPPVQHVRVGDHEHALEDPEEPLVPDEGGDRLPGRIRRVQGRGEEILDGAVDGADGDEAAGAVERDEHVPDIRLASMVGEDSRPGGAAVVRPRHGEEEAHDGELEDESGFEEGLAEVLFCLCFAGDGLCGAVGGEDFDADGEAEEEAGEDEVVAEFVEGGGGVEEHEGGDEDVDVGVVVGAGDAEGVAGDKEEGGPRVDPGYAPGFIERGLVEVENARDGEEDREDDRGDLVGGVIPEAAVDWGLLDVWWLRGGSKGPALTILSVFHCGNGALLRLVFGVIRCSRKL